ncbi:MAG: sensor histidine kinase [Acidimicrobiia bacterium]
MGQDGVGGWIPIRAMKTMAWALGAVLIAGLLVAEIAMDVTPTERRQVYAVFGAMAMITFLTALLSLKVAARFGSLRTSLQVVAFAAVAVTGAVVATASLTMFIEPHDLTVVLVALVLGVGLGGVVAAAVARPLTDDVSAMSSTARRVAGGDLTARTGIVRSDELGTAALAFDEMVRKLQISEEERGHLLTAIGHDLRTPLTSMQAAVEALQDGMATDPAAYLRGLSHDLDHLTHLVDDLFLLSRIDAGRLEISPIAVDLSELADEAVEAVLPMAARRHIKVSVKTPGRVGVAGDPAALGRVFRNLLNNAIRHSPDAGEVKIQLSISDSRVDTLVIDQGGGFPHSIRSHAFERFVRADESRSRESGGTGLGLAIARAIVEAHGGTIAIEDGPGGRVRFALPLGR